MTPAIGLKYYDIDASTPTFADDTITVPDRGGRISSCGLVGAAVIVECDASC